MKKNDQITRTRFLAKYGGVSIYDIDSKKKYPIDDEEINFVKEYGHALIGKLDHTDETSTDNEYFFIHDDLFNRILETDQNSDIELKAVHKYVSLSSINENSTYPRSQFRSRSETVSTRHYLHRKRN